MTSRACERRPYPYALGCGYVLRRHGYTWWEFGGFLRDRSGGAVFSLCKGDLPGPRTTGCEGRASCAGIASARARPCPPGRAANLADGTIPTKIGRQDCARDRASGSRRGGEPGLLRSDRHFPGPLLWRGHPGCLRAGGNDFSVAATHHRFRPEAHRSAAGGATTRSWPGKSFAACSIDG